MAGRANTADTIQAWLLAKLAERLGIEPHEIDTGEPLASYGLGSTEAVSLAGELAEWLGRDLSAALVYEHPTIEALAGHLAGSTDVSAAAARGGRDAGASGEAIAIIGLGCRFPGANDPGAFWRLLRDGGDAIREVPADRFDRHAFYDPDPAAPGKMNTRWGGFLDQVDQFDANFFGISPREALRMDPQQRLLLEVTWEALQDAGQVPERLTGSPVGVFIGIATNDYGRLQWDDLERIDAYSGTGNAQSIAANRISYVFDFRGPSLAIDTACSSSLVAVHLACCSLRNGESTLALAGGVNLILSPAIAINFTKAGAMAPDGRCKTFDARADGYVRSEGAGVVVLKRLSKALADSDPIYAVIRGSAVNQDGRSNGLMAPNPLAQEAVLRDAYRKAGVSPAEVQYVEAHGTGTLLGDPIEVKALGTVLGAERPPGRPCAVGSVKTNLGHLEAAAGVAGVIKVALSLRHREIPPSLHFETPNPHISFDRLSLRVQTALTPWPAAPGPAVAGVSSFGFGGTNAHVVLEEAPPDISGMAWTEGKTGAQLLPLSARDPQALRSLVRATQDFLAAPEAAASLPDICYTASVRLGHHDHRLAVTGDSPAQLTDSLAAFLAGETRPGLSHGRKPSARRRKLAFVFPGQGGQWLGMGQRLVEKEAVFREVIERCDEAMRPYGDWSLLAELAATDAALSRLNEIDIIQPATFAIQVALAALWRSWGVVPDAVVGHSLGEVAAAHVAGALSFDDAVRVICHRSRLVKPTIGQGAMAAVELSLEEARRVLVGVEDRVSVAASNGPSSTVLSGDPGTLASILDQLQRDDIFCRMVKVDFASHSPQMEPLGADLLRALEGMQPRADALPIYSTVTGQIAHGTEFNVLYWARNLREPVLFSTVVQRLVEDGHDIFLELSPHAILISAMQQVFYHFGHNCTALASLRHHEDESTVLLGSLGALYTLGYPVDWDAVYPTGGRCVQFPFYPWQRERCWLEPAVRNTSSHESQVVQRKTRSHPFLGKHFFSPHLAGTHVWETALDKSLLPYLDDHRIQGVAVLPASAYLEMALAAAGEVLGAQPVVLKNIEFREAVFLPDGATRTIQVILSQGENEAATFQVYSSGGDADYSGETWTLHAIGKICLDEEGELLATNGRRQTITDMRARCLEHTSGQEYYRTLHQSGVQYGSFFQLISNLYKSSEDVLGEIRVPEWPGGVDFGVFQIHPGILDAGLQIFGAAVAANANESQRQGLYLPIRIDQFRLHRRPGDRQWCRASVRQREAASTTGDVQLLDETGGVALEIQGLRFEYLGENTRRLADDNPGDWLYELQWRPERLATAEPSGPASWLIFKDSGGAGDELCGLLEARGERCIRVTRGESYEQVDRGHYRICPGHPNDIRRLFDAALVSDQPRCRGIVHLWSLDVAPPEETTVASLHAAETLGCGTALLLAQELARTELPDLPRLWLITRGAQAVGEALSPLSVAQAPLWGLGRVIAQEHPTFWGGLVDLDHGACRGDAEARQMWEEISATSGEDQLAFRDDRRYLARLLRRRPSIPQPLRLRWRTDGTYLISGGLGDLGLLIARWMVEQGARRLILLGRTALPPRSDWSAAEPGSRLARQITAIRDLESLGACVHPASVDVADEAALSGFLDAFRAEGWPPIRGAVHAAGALQDGLLVQLDAAALTAVLRPKVTGGWLLHRLLRDDPLEFFVLFSSAGAILGQPGQGNYAAANAFLDALAHHRRAQGQPALSINWGAWAGKGFAASVGGQRLAARLALLGISSIAPERALEVLRRLLWQSATQVVAVPVDWKQYRETFPAGGTPPLLSELALKDAEFARPSHPTKKLRDTLLAAEPTERRQLLQSYLSEQMARALGLSPAKLDLQQPLSHLGLDSLMAVELKNRIALDLKVNIPLVKFLQDFSVEQAVTQVLEQLGSEAVNPTAPLAPADARLVEQQDAERLLASLDQLTDEQVSSLLADMLDEHKDGTMPC
jgi:myxalamid-type polyketide synthase MxaE and MxaD